MILNFSTQINAMKSKVYFFNVKDNQAKIHLICSKAKESFEQEKRLQILVPTIEAGQYIDSLLWRYPEDSFLTHILTTNLSSEWIVITTEETVNLNLAARLLNLCPHPVKYFSLFAEIYELYDESHPQKLENSKLRFKNYQDWGLALSLLK